MLKKPRRKLSAGARPGMARRAYGARKVAKRAGMARRKGLRGR